MQQSAVEGTPEFALRACGRPSQSCTRRVVDKHGSRRLPKDLAVAADGSQLALVMERSSPSSHPYWWLAGPTAIALALVAWVVQSQELDWREG